MDKLEPKNGQTAPRHDEIKSCTIDEFIARMEPAYRKQQAVIEKCLAGLTVYAAGLAANGQMDDRLRDHVDAMPLFWGLEQPEQYLTAFDQAVSEAQSSGAAPELSEPGKADILAGLTLYAQELRLVDMEPWAQACDSLAAEIWEQWQAGPELGGMSL